MHKKWRYGIGVVLLVLQLGICYMIDQNLSHDRILYESISNDKKAKVIIYQGGDQYKIKALKNDQVLNDSVLKNGFQRIKDVTWIGNNYIMLSYVDENYHTGSLQFDFTQRNALADDESLLRAAQEDQREQEKEEQKVLEKEDSIKTETGISFDKNDTIAITFDYGRHWKDTGIYVSQATFQTSGGLRLSDESYYLSKEFTYFYYVDSKGWLIYTYSLDAGETWTVLPSEIAAFNAVWFKAGMLQNHQPYFFMADKLNDNLIFYQSVDQGHSFQQYPSDLTRDINLLHDISYINDNLMFVTYYEYGDIFRSVDHGLTYEAIHPDNMNHIHQLKAPMMKDGKLQMIGIDTSGREVIFFSNDQGITWTRQ